MKLKIMLPTMMLVDEEVRKVVAEAENGSFCLLPRHVDFVSSLVPGILFYETAEGREKLIALDEGVLVKAGDEVFVSTAHAITGERVGELREKVEDRFRRTEDRDRHVRGAAARLEADLVRKFVELD